MRRNHPQNDQDHFLKPELSARKGRCVASTVDETQAPCTLLVSSVWIVRAWGASSGREGLPGFRQ